jgi:hypothetical protein
MFRLTLHVCMLPVIYFFTAVIGAVEILLALLIFAVLISRKQIFSLSESLRIMKLLVSSSVIKLLNETGG